MTAVSRLFFLAGIRFFGAVDGFWHCSTMMHSGAGATCCLDHCGAATTCYV
jgi:hypothetical protein